MLDASFCYQYEWKFPFPYDGFSCCDSCLKSKIFMNSPVHPEGLRATRKKNGTVDATTMSAGNPSTRLLQYEQGSIDTKHHSFQMLSLSHDTVLMARSKIQAFFLLILPPWNGLDGQSAKNRKCGFYHSVCLVSRCFCKLYFFVSFSHFGHPNSSCHAA